MLNTNHPIYFTEKKSRKCELYTFSMSTTNQSIYFQNGLHVQSNLSIVVTWGRLTKWPLYTGDLYMKGFDFSTKYCTLVVNKHFSLHLMFLIMFYLLFCSCRNIHWGRADDRNCNYDHPKMADMKLGKNLFCWLNCFYSVF